MTDSEITIGILRQIHDKLGLLHEDNKLIHDELRALKGETSELKAEAVITNQRLSVVESTVRDLAAQLVMLGRYVKNSHDKAITDLRRRVARLEKKVG